MKTEEKNTSNKLLEELQAKIAKRAEELKKTHNNVFAVVVKVSDEEYAVAYLKKPSRQVLSASMSLVEQDPIRSDEIILQGCWIEGDERIKTDDDLFFAVTPHLRKLMEFKTAELKKY